MGDFIDPRELEEHRGAENAPLIVDVRGVEEYEAGHVPGAINIPLGELAERVKEMPEGRLIVPY